MFLRVDPASAVSIAEQIAVQLRAAVADGSLEPGSRLPPARELADSLGINMHTVLRAYARLRDDAIIDMRQGRGAFVRTDVRDGTARLVELSDALLSEARKLGVGLTGVIELIQKRGRTHE